MRIVYLDLNNSGISGDMFLASLLGIIPKPDEFLIELREIKDYISGVSKLNIELIQVLRSGIQINQLKINIEETKDHRSAKTLQKALNSYLDAKNLSIPAKNYANQVLNSLILAEQEVHGELVKKIHLHELSSVDTLIDILGVTMALDFINGFEDDFQVFCSKIPLGGGKIKTTHGELTVPTPATSKILEKSKLITYGGPIDSELITPTGAALLTSLNPTFLQYSPEMMIGKSVYATGQKKFKEFQNILRLVYGESKGKHITGMRHTLQNYIEQVTLLETDVDDVSGELLGNFIDQLNKEKILDVQIVPSFTKKNRPSHIIKVLCLPGYTFELIEKIIHELGTLGVRFNTLNRV
ncbi:MAG: LarC family nickel insertion protein, partial [Promethearchaeota archaeon]